MSVSPVAHHLGAHTEDVHLMYDDVQDLIINTHRDKRYDWCMIFNRKYLMHTHTIKFSDFLQSRHDA